MDESVFLAARFVTAAPNLTGEWCVLYWRVRTWCLEFHANYRCQHRGACCRAPWDIEVEPAVVQAVTAGRIVPLHAEANPFSTDSSGVVTLTRTPAGACHFHRASRCSLQAAAGEEMLPSACRHFPRVLLLDARGCLLTLSHYCPTAAGLLVDGGAIAVVEARPPLALPPPLEGLDARDVLPPLLRPGMLMDVESYARFETACLATFGSASNVEFALQRVAAAVEEIRRWQPGDAALGGRVDEAFAAAVPATAPARLSTGYGIALSLTGPHPWMALPDNFEARWDAAVDRGGASLQQLLARYMAAATFGNWMPYRGEGLRSVVAWLRACYDIIRIQIVREFAADPELPRTALIEAVRAADYLVVHTVDSLAFGRAAVAFEHSVPA